MADTTHLQLPLLAAAQAQKHVTHNDALLRLDALVQLAVKDRDLTAPPASPSDGDRYIPASGSTGAWVDWDLNIAWYSDGVWTKLVPREGWRVWVDDEDMLLIWDGASWQAGGDVAGPASSVNSRPALFDGTTGKLLKQHSAVLGTAAAANIGTSGDTVPKLDVENTWSARQTIRRLYSHALTVADDAAATIDFSAFGYSVGLILFAINTNSGLITSVPAGLFRARAGAAPSIENVSLNLTNVVLTTGALTGTSGTDGKVTISVHTDNKLYIENRSAASRVFTILVVD
jgi:hypothetical protein